MLTAKNISLVAIFAALFFNSSAIGADFVFGDEVVPPTQVNTTGSNCTDYQVIFETGGKCYNLGGAYDNEPCGNGTIGQSPNNEKLGICYCQPAFLGSSIRANIYHRTQKKCFPIYTQGPCKSSQWLVIRNFIGTCEENPCHNDSSTTGDLVPFRGQCLPLDKPSKYCKDEETIRFGWDGVGIQCGIPNAPFLEGSPSVVPLLSCGEGESLGEDNLCHPIVTLSEDEV